MRPFLKEATLISSQEKKVRQILLFVNAHIAKCLDCIIINLLHESSIIVMSLILVVIDHGVAQVEMTMEDALQDIPPLVHDIQERLRGMSEAVAVDGKPRSGLPNRRLLWDKLKPQASLVCIQN